MRPSVSVGKPWPWIFGPRARRRRASGTARRPAPPLVAIHGSRRNCQIAANTVRGCLRIPRQIGRAARRPDVERLRPRCGRRRRSRRRRARCCLSTDRRARATIARFAFFGIDEDLRDQRGVVEPGVLPVLRAVARDPHAVAVRDVVARVRLARCRPKRSSSSLGATADRADRAELRRVASHTGGTTRRRRST